MDSAYPAERPRRVEEVMLRDVITAPLGATLVEAEAVLRSARLRHLVVVEDGIVVGLVSHRDLLDASLAALRDRLGARSADVLHRTTIERLVREEPATIAPDGSLEAAANRMLALRIGCLPVTNDALRGPRLVGLLTEAGLLRTAYLPPTPRV
jgi:CBS domain-containing membrane protein